jgi:hypothetical protein
MTLEGMNMMSTMGKMVVVVILNPKLGPKQIFCSIFIDKQESDFRRNNVRNWYACIERGFQVVTMEVIPGIWHGG